MSARAVMVLWVLLVLSGVAGVLPAGAAAEQASQPGSEAAGGLDAGWNHTCALLASYDVRCWGFGGNGELGYANTSTIGDDDVPGLAGPVNLGPGRTAVAIAAGRHHSCAVLENGRVLCWGFGGDGRLGYGNTSSIGDDETPGSVAPVDLGGPATAITAGESHTCALLQDQTVRCWGFGGDGRLGYGNTSSIEAAASAAPVSLGGSAMAVSAGDYHTCALLVGGNVRCWGFGIAGRLGYN